MKKEVFVVPVILDSVSGGKGRKKKVMEFREMGMCGVMPVFDDIMEANKFAGSIGGSFNNIMQFEVDTDASGNAVLDTGDMEAGHEQ